MNPENIADVTGIELTIYLTLCSICKILFGDSLSEDDEQQSSVIVGEQQKDGFVDYLQLGFIGLTQLVKGICVVFILRTVIRKLVPLLQATISPGDCETDKITEARNREGIEEAMDSNLLPESVDDVDVNESIHEENMKRAMSMLSMINTPPESGKENTVETFTEEQNLDLDLDLPLSLSFENDSIESFHDADSDPSMFESDDVTFDVVTPHEEKIENATMRKIVNDRTNVVKDTVLMFEKKFSLTSGTTLSTGSSSSRLPLPSTPTTPRQHRFTTTQDQGHLKGCWDAFESTTPRKCLINISPHSPINAASGDRMLKPVWEKKQSVYTMEVADNDYGRIQPQSDHNLNICSEMTPWTENNQDVVSQTTEWVVYSD